MTTRLPLVAAQPGIWMAERLSTLPGAWSVAHYVELSGSLDPALLGRAIVAGIITEKGVARGYVSARRVGGEEILPLFESYFPASAEALDTARQNWLAANGQ